MRHGAGRNVVDAAHFDLLELRARHALQLAQLLAQVVEPDAALVVAAQHHRRRYTHEAARMYAGISSGGIQKYSVLILNYCSSTLIVLYTVQ